MNIRTLTATQLSAMLPESCKRWVGGILAPEDGRAEPAVATNAIAAAAARRGATVVTNCAVRTIETKAGRVCGVVTEKGPIGCEKVVLAGGAWSRLFCGNLNIDLPQLRVLASVLRTTPLNGGPELAVKTQDFSFRRRLDGGYTVATAGTTISHITPETLRQFRRFLPTLRAHWTGLRLRVDMSFYEDLRTPRRWRSDEVTPFERMRVLDPKPSQAILDRTFQNLCASFPIFNKCSISTTWGGIIDVTPDVSPIIDELAQMPGLFIATGFSGHGFGIGPGVGRILADLVEGKRPAIDIRPFAFARFFS